MNAISRIMDVSTIKKTEERNMLSNKKSNLKTSKSVWKIIRQY